MDVAAHWGMFRLYRHRFGFHPGTIWAIVLPFYASWHNSSGNLEPFFCDLLLAARPSYLHHPSSKDLSGGIQIIFAPGYCGEELIGIVIVVLASEHVDDCSNKAPIFCGVAVAASIPYMAPA